GVAGGSLLIHPRLIDIQQIEIGKGPQSALYGRSAFAGAISYTTLDPAKEFSGGLAADASGEEQYELRANLSMPFSDSFGARLSGYWFDDGGYYRNQSTGGRVGGGRGKGGALTLKWEPNERYDLKFRTEYSDDRFRQPAQTALAFNAFNTVPAAASICNIGTNAAGAPAPIGFVIDRNCPLTPATIALGLNAYRELDRLTGNLGVFDDMTIPTVRGSLGDADNLVPTFSPDFAKSTDNGVTAPDFPGSNRQVTRLSAIQSYDFGPGKLASLTGYTRALVSTDFDIDKTNFLPIQQSLRTDNITEQFSQELRFSSDFEGPLQFIVGLQLWTERADQFDRNNTVIGAGTMCFAFDPPGPAPAIEAPPGMAGPLTIPAGSCTPPTGGFTSASVAPFMDDVAAVRVPTWLRRLVDHKSVYLEIEWSILDNLKLIAEARRIDEDNDVTAGFTDGQSGTGTVVLCGSNGPCRNGAGIPAAGFPPVLPPMGFSAAPVTRYITYPTRNDKYTTPKVTLTWEPWESGTIYLSYAEGRKPGGYTTITIGGAGAPLNPADISFEAEKIEVT
ncbi:MAG: TonB-dependent receptor, partial [Steroidobacteraceae bacterium]|nr:TonB-dependent receptor [Steroidobacteraceae bacterium]MDW8258108.1 TonB-dependent receptor [Gammaproteobacteria bacterium]